MTIKISCFCLGVLNKVFKYRYVGTVVVKELTLTKSSSFFLVFLCSPRGIVDERVLEQREEDEGDAQVGPDVDGLGVRHGRELVVD